MRHSDMAQVNDTLATQNKILKDTLNQTIDILQEVQAMNGLSWRKEKIQSILDRCVVIGLLPDDYNEYS